MKADDIKKNRDRLDLSRAKLAKMIGVARSTIANYENGGTIPEERLRMLVKILSQDKIANPSGLTKTATDLNQLTNDIDSMIEAKKKEPQSLENIKAIHDLLSIKLAIELDLNKIDSNQL